MKNLSLHTLCPLFVTLAMSACGPVNNLDDMHTDMKTLVGQMTEMGGDIKTMSNQMGGMGDDIKTMSGQMTGMGSDIKTMSGQMNVMVEMNATMKDMATKMGMLEKMGITMDQMSTKMSILADMNVTMKDLSTKMAMLNQMNLTMEEMATKMSLLKDMNEKMTYLKNMNAKIESMASQMTGLNQHIVVMTNQMGGLVGDIKKMDGTLNLTHSDLRTVFTGEHRINSLKAMDEASSQSGKFGYAAEYMTSQTFQSWNAKVDSVNARNTLIELAMGDFLMKLVDYISDRDSFDPSKTDSKSEGLYALAMTIDYINAIQLDGLVGSKEKPVSMMSLIEDGLRAAHLVKIGKKKYSEVPLYQRDVIDHEQDAIYLLRIRETFSKATAYSLANEGTSGNAPSLGKSAWELAKGLVGIQYDSQIGNKNPTQIGTITKALECGIEAQEFLLSIGVEPKTDFKIKTLIKGMRVPNREDLKVSSAAYDQFVNALKKVQSLDDAEK